MQVLAYATLMLNVSVHSPKLRERDRMTKAGFLSMLRGCDNGGDLPPELLESVFHSISADGIMVRPSCLLVSLASTPGVLRHRCVLVASPSVGDGVC
jgi:hypothetical protein